MKLRTALMFVALLVPQPAPAQQPSPPTAEGPPDKTASGTSDQTPKAPDQTPAKEAESPEGEKPTGLAGWICDKTGWLFCGLPHTGVPRGPRSDGERALASYELAEQRETILLEDCTSCRALATLGGGSVAVLKPSGLFRWSPGSTELELLLERDDLVDLLGRPANDAGALLLTAGKDAAICPSILRFDFESGALTDFPTPFTGREVSECAWVMAGARVDQFDSAFKRQLLATGGGEFRASILISRDLETGDTTRLAETGPLADARSRHAPIWLSDGMIAYLVSRR